MKKSYIIYALLALALITGFFWLSGHSYVEIIVDNPASSGGIDYAVVTQSNNKTTITKNGPTTIKRLVNKGGYQTTVTQNDSSAFNVINAGGFLTKKTVHITLAKQKERTFVGNNPGVCGQYTGKLLMSFECHGQFQDAIVHVPAAGNTPTYTQKIRAAGVDGSIESIIQTKEGTVALVRGQGHADSSPASDSSPLTLYLLREDATLSSTSAPVPSLSDKTPYTLLPYKDGFILYNNNLNQVFQFASVAAKPTRLNIGSAKNEKLVPVAFDVHGDSAVGAFTDATDPEETNDTETAKPRNYRLVVTTKDKVKEYGYKGIIASVKFCGEANLCILDESKVGVYTYNGKLRHVYDITSVKGIAPMGEKLLLAIDTGIIDFDTQTRSGSMDYRFGNYTFCGVQANQTNYNLCVVDRKNNRSALLVNPSQDDSDMVDQKISQVAGLIYVSNVSVYGNNIFISANLGAAKYRPELNGYDYDPATKKAATDAINQAIDQAGINRAKYRITILN